RALVFGIPLTLGVAERKDPFLGARSLFIAARSADGSVKSAGAQSVQQRFGLQQSTAALGSQAKGIRAIVDRILIGVNDELCAHLPRVPVAELDHLAKFVRGVDVEQRKRNRSGMECLLRQSEQDGRILSDRIQHYGA